MDDDERLREALIELEALRASEADQLRQTNALVTSMEALAKAESAIEGIEALIQSITEELSCEFVAVFRVVENGLALEFPRLQPDVHWETHVLSKRSRRYVDVRDVPPIANSLPDRLSKWRSLLSIPVNTRIGPFVLAAFAESQGFFRSSDSRLFERFSRIAIQALNRKMLEEKSAFLAAVINGSPASVAIADASDKALPLVFINDAFTELTGYSAGDVLGRNCRFLSAEPPDSPSRTALREATQDLTGGQFTVLNRRKDGSEFWNDLRLFPIHDAGGTITNLVAVQTDATDRVEAERERDEARRRLEAALGATSEGFLVLGSDGDIRFANDSFRDFFSRSAEFEQGEPIPRDVAIDTLGKAGEDVAETLAIARAEVSREVRLADGRFVMVSARPVPGGGAVIAASDITRIKVTEAILRQRVAAIEMAQDGIAITDASDRVIYANPRLLGMWKLESEDSAVGRRWKHFYAKEASERFAAEGPNDLNRFGSWRGELECEREGELRTHEVSLSRIPEVGTIMIVSDITDRVRGEEERHDLLKRLDRAEMQETFGQVSAGLAHDLNNLLSAIIGSASVISSQADLPENASSAARRIEEAGYRAADLVNALLDFGQRDKSAEPLDLRTVVRSSIDLARANLPAEVRMSTAVDGAPIQTVASQTDILQVVMNLLFNGIDAIGEESGEIRIALDSPAEQDDPTDVVFGKWRPDARYAVIEISDTGHGMDPKTASDMLRPYMTTKGNKGTGLGLAIVTSILKRNDGCLALDTEPGRGTRFTAYWRLDSPKKPQAVQSEATETTAGLPVLVIDDDAEVARGITNILMAAGFEVAETETPEIGLETVSEDPESWGCIVSDYDMPGMNGGELVEALGDIAPGLPTIVVSALAKRLDDPRLLGANVRAVLSKPVRADILVSAVREATRADEASQKGSKDAHSSC